MLQRFNEGEAPAKRGTRVGDKLHGLTGGRPGWMVDGKDQRPLEVGQAQDVQGANGTEGYQGGGNPSRQGGDGHMIGHEWETKWSKGTQQRQMDFAKGLDIKVETVVSHLGCGGSLS